MKFADVRMFFFLLAIVVVVILFVAPAYAGDDDYGSGGSGGATTLSTGSTSLDVVGATLNSDAYVMGSHALGDVDINQCIVTKQKGSFIVSWQGYDYNLWCMGEVYDAKGLHNMAAIMRCDIPVIVRHFEHVNDCITDNTVHPVNHVEPDLVELYNRAARFDDAEEEYEERYVAQQMEIEAIQEQLATQQARPRVVRVAPPSEKDLYWTEERRSKLEAIKGEM